MVRTELAHAERKYWRRFTRPGTPAVRMISEVLNLGSISAVSMNYISGSNFARSVRYMRFMGEPELAAATKDLS